MDIKVEDNLVYCQDPTDPSKMVLTKEETMDTVRMVVEKLEICTYCLEQVKPCYCMNDE